MSALGRLVAGMVLAATLLLGGGVPVLAHGIETQTLTEGAVAVEFRFTDGTAMADADAVVYAPNRPGEPVVTGRTDAKGRFSFYPDQDGDWVVEVHDTEHVARAVVSVVAHHATETRRAFPDWLVAISLVFNVLAAGWLGRRRRSRPAAAPLFSTSGGEQ